MTTELPWFITLFCYTIQQYETDIIKIKILGDSSTPVPACVMTPTAICVDAAIRSVSVLREGSITDALASINLNARPSFTVNRPG